MHSITRLKGELLKLIFIQNRQVWAQQTSKEIENVGEEINENQPKVWKLTRNLEHVWYWYSKGRTLHNGNFYRANWKYKRKFQEKISEFLTFMDTWHLWDTERNLFFWRQIYTCVCIYTYGLFIYRWKTSNCAKLIKWNTHLLQKKGLI